MTTFIRGSIYLLQEPTNHTPNLNPIIEWSHKCQTRERAEIHGTQNIPVTDI
jgi:hypothetical protein